LILCFINTIIIINVIANIYVKQKRSIIGDNDRIKKNSHIRNTTGEKHEVVFIKKE